MNTVHLNRERLKQSRQKVTITGESRVAYARIEVPHLTGIPEKVLKEYEAVKTFPPSSFLWGEKLYTGCQLTLLYAFYRNAIGWQNLIEHWEDADTDDDLWPHLPDDTSRPILEENQGD